MMKEQRSLNPVFCAALGAAAGYYGLMPFTAGRFALPVLIIALAIAVAFCAWTRVRASLAPRSYRLRRDALFVLSAAAGFVLGAAALTAAQRASVVRMGLPARDITGLAGTLLDDPRSSASGRGLATLKLSGAAGRDGVRSSARGFVTVFFPDEAMPRLKGFGRGSALYIEGTLAEAKTGRGLLFRAKATHITAPPRPIDRLRTVLRRGITALFTRGDWGGLALALLVGIKDNLDGGLAAQYRNAGCSYILALSGMHLAIVSSIIALLLKKPLGIRPAAIIGAAFIIGYIYLVGAQPSLARAGIAALIGTLALLRSFTTGALHLLALSFIVQLFVEPASGGTVSFVLSYLALAGILLIGEPLSGVLRGRLPALIAQPLAASLGAFLATMAVTASFFGSVRVAGIIAGLVMVPLTTVFMMGAIVFLVLHAIPPLAALAAPPLETGLSLVYALLEKISALAGGVPALPGVNLPAFVIISCALPVAITLICRRAAAARSAIGIFG